MSDLLQSNLYFVNITDRPVTVRAGRSGLVITGHHEASTGGDIIVRPFETKLLGKRPPGELEIVHYMGDEETFHVVPISNTHLGDDPTSVARDVILFWVKDNREFLEWIIGRNNLDYFPCRPRVVLIV